MCRRPSLRARNRFQPENSSRPWADGIRRSSPKSACRRWRSWTQRRPIIRCWYSWRSPVRRRPTRLGKAFFAGKGIEVSATGAIARECAIAGRIERAALACRRSRTRSAGPWMPWRIPPASASPPTSTWARSSFRACPTSKIPSCSTALQAPIRFTCTMRSWRCTGRKRWRRGCACFSSAWTRSPTSRC